MEISVIITAYNKASYIKKCLLGVLDQDFQGEFEVILADDCSTDNTYEEINSLREHPNFVKVKYTRHSKNKGLMGNFIWVLNQAKGTYIALCDGDDVWTSKNKLSRQIEVLESNKSFLALGTREKIIDTRNNIDKIKYSDLYWDYENSLVIKKEDFMHPNRLPFHTSTLMFRNIPEVIYYLNKFSYVLIGNDIVLYHILNSSGNIYFLNETFVARSHNESGITNHSNSRTLDLILNFYVLYNDCAALYDNAQHKNQLFILSQTYFRKSTQKFSNRSIIEISKRIKHYIKHGSYIVLRLYLLILYNKVFKHRVQW